MIESKEQALDRLWLLYSSEHGKLSGEWVDSINDQYLKYYTMMESCPLLDLPLQTKNLVQAIPMFNWTEGNYLLDEWIALSTNIMKLEFKYHQKNKDL